MREQKYLNVTSGRKIQRDNPRHHQQRQDPIILHCTTHRLRLPLVVVGLQRGGDSTRLGCVMEQLGAESMVVICNLIRFEQSQDLGFFFSFLSSVKRLHFLSNFLGGTGYHLPLFQQWEILHGVI